MNGRISSPATSRLIPEGWASWLGFGRHVPIKNTFSRMSVFTTSSPKSWLDPHGPETVYPLSVLEGSSRGKRWARISPSCSSSPPGTQPPHPGVPCGYDRLGPEASGVVFVCPRVREHTRGEKMFSRNEQSQRGRTENIVCGLGAQQMGNEWLRVQVSAYRDTVGPKEKKKEFYYVPSWSSRLSLPIAKIPDVCHHTQMYA